MNYTQLFSDYKEPKLHGRYITLNDIAPLLESFKNNGELKISGHSVLEKPIYTYKIGQGKTKMLLWSQMHGNESTTTKALIDFLNFLNSNSDEAVKLLEAFTFLTIPMLNPDGALFYTRENANKIDLNRDFCNLTQPESNLLLAIFKDFAPDYCYNLHDQRTIYGVADSGKPATVSFLAPSFNEEREMNHNRSKAASVIAAMNETLQRFIPGQVGRFDDSFNINCVGDTFQSLNVPTVLFEAGHFPGDYDREETRKFIFIALVSGLTYINENVVVNNRIADYLNIPQNKMNFYDFVYKNIKINYDGNEIITNFATQFNEELIENAIAFQAYVAEVGTDEAYFGHLEYNGEKELYTDNAGNFPKLDQKADFKIGDSIFRNGQKVD